MLKKKQTIDPERIPQHIGFILDGNGRWATKRGLMRKFGHKAGVDAIMRTVDAAMEYGIKIITLYAFSTENWKRDKEEVDYIFQLLRDQMGSISEKYDNVKIRTMGDLSRLPEDLKEKLEEATEKTKDRTGLIFNLAVNYGARSEIIRAINLILEKKTNHITEEEFSNYLYTEGLCDPDLIIRTSGEQRLSNFMLYQCAYSEFYFPDVYWPDFDKKELEKAILVYQSRNRRYGGLK